MSELLPCPSTIPPAQPSKVVAALRKLMPILEEADSALRDFSIYPRFRHAAHRVNEALAELGEARPHAAFDKYGEWKDRP